MDLHRVKPTAFAPDGEYPGRASIASPAEAFQRIKKHVAQEHDVSAASLLTSIQRELALSTSHGEPADNPVEELEEAVFGFLWFVDRGYIAFEGTDGNSVAVLDLRRAAFRLFPERRDRYIARLNEARGRDVLAEDPRQPVPAFLYREAR